MSEQGPHASVRVLMRSLSLFVPLLCTGLGGIWLASPIFSGEANDTLGLPSGWRLHDAP